MMEGFRLKKRLREGGLVLFHGVWVFLVYAVEDAYTQRFECVFLFLFLFFLFLVAARGMTKATLGGKKQGDDQEKLRSESTPDNTSYHLFL